MKKNRLPILICVIITLILCVCVMAYMEVYKPLNGVLAKLDVSQVESISFSFFGNGEEVVLSDEHTAVLVEQLKKVRLNGRAIDDSITYDTASPGRWFRVKLKNGYEFTIAACNPLYIINGEKRYKADYAVCDEIGRLYSEWLWEYFPSKR